MKVNVQGLRLEKVGGVLDVEHKLVLSDQRGNVERIVKYQLNSEEVFIVGGHIPCKVEALEIKLFSLSRRNDINVNNRGVKQAVVEICFHIRAKFDL